MKNDKNINVNKTSSKWKIITEVHGKQHQKANRKISYKMENNIKGRKQQHSLSIMITINI